MAFTWKVDTAEEFRQEVLRQLEEWRFSAVTSSTLPLSISDQIKNYTVAETYENSIEFFKELEILPKTEKTPRVVYLVSDKYDVHSIWENMDEAEQYIRKSSRRFWEVVEHHVISNIEDQLLIERAATRKAALNKLSPEEKEVLGLLETDATTKP